MAEDAGNIRSRAKLRKRRKVRRLLWGLTTIVLLLLIIVAALPTLISTGPGTQATLSLVRSISGYDVKADALAVSWTGGQNLRDVSVTPANESWSLSVGQVQASQVSLWSLATGGRNVGEIRAEPIRFVQNTSPADRTEPAPSEPEEEDTDGEQPTGMPNFPDVAKGLTFTFKSNRITYEAPNAPTTEVRDLIVSADLSNMQAIQASVKGQFLRGEETGQLDANANLTDAFTDAAQPQFDKARVKANVDVNDLPIASIDSLAGMQGKLVALLGNTLNAKAEVPEAPLSDLTAKLTAASETLNADMQLARVDEQIRGNGSTATLTVMPEAYQTLTGAKSNEQGAQLTKPVEVALNVNTLAMPRPTKDLPFGKALEQAMVDVSVDTGDVAMQVPNQGDVSLTDFNIAVVTKALAEQIEAKLAGNLTMAGETGQLEAGGTIENPLSEQPSASLTAERLPVVIADAIAQQQGRLAGTVGATLDATANVQPAENDAGERGWRIDATLSSDQLNAPLVGAYYPGKALQLKTAPEAMSLTLSANAANAWLNYGRAADQSRSTRVAGPMPVTANVQNLTLAMNNAGGIDYGQSGVLAKLTIDATPVVNTTSNERYNIGGTVELAGSDLDEQLKAILNLFTEAAAAPQDGDNQPSRGSIKSTTTLTNLVAGDGALNYDGAQIDSTTNVQSVPSGLFDALSGQEGLLAGLLGPRTNADVMLKHQMGQGGNADVALNADNTQGTIKATVDKDQTLTLTEDATLAMRVTPELSEAVLSRISPALRSLVGARAPLKLTVEQDGFKLPLKDFAMERVQGRAHMEQAQVTLASEGFVGQVLGVLSKTGALGGQDQYGATLTATDLAMRDGNLSYQNLGLNISDVLLDFSGSMRFPDNRMDLEMTLAGDRMPDEISGLSFPVSGPIDGKPKFDTKRFAEAAAKQGVEKAIERGLGELFGGKKKKQNDKDKNGGDERDEPRRSIFD
jgi:hypothetical protein